MAASMSGPKQDKSSK